MARFRRTNCIGGTIHQLEGCINQFAEMDAGFVKKRYYTTLAQDGRLKLSVWPGDKWPIIDIGYAVQLPSQAGEEVLKLDIIMDSNHYAQWGKDAYDRLMSGLIDYGFDIDYPRTGGEVAEHSMWPTGKFEGDNVDNVSWQCNSCGVRIPTKEEAIRHVRQDHQEGVITPHLNDVGHQLAKLSLFLDASKPLAEFLAQRLGQDFCRAMGAEPLFVSRQGAATRELVVEEFGEELFKRIVSIMRYVRQIVEQQNGHRLLTQSENGTRILKDETELQIALAIMLKPRCEALNIDVTREGETGRGLLDFKFSRGNDSIVFLEVKKFDHSRLEHGLEIQLPTYMQANRVRYGIFVPITIDPNTYEAKLAMLSKAVEELNSQSQFQIEMVDIQAWKPDSASRAAKLDDAIRYDPVEIR